MNDNHPRDETWAFRDDYGSRCPGGLLIHGGSEVQWLSDRILGVPWHRIL